MRKEFYIFIGLVAVLSFAMVGSAQAAAGTLDHPSTTPATTYGGRTDSFTINFQVASSTPTANGARVRLIFPSAYGVPSTVATTSITASVSAAGIVGSSTVSGQEITLWLADGAAVAAGEVVTFTGIPGLKNPAAGGSFTLGIETRGPSDDLYESASGTAFTIIAAPVGEAATADTSPPKSTITLPASGATITAGQKYTIEGIGTDPGGSAVTSVEVSVDDGKTWLSAMSSSTGGLYDWSYVWTNPTAGEYTIRVRATDAGGNMESPGTGVKVTVPGASSAPTPAPTPPVVEKPIAQMTTAELQATIASLQQQLITLLQQLIQVLTAQL